MSTQDIALARSIYDDVCMRLSVPLGPNRQRDEVAAQVMLGLHNGSRDAAATTAKIMAALKATCDA